MVNVPYVFHVYLSFLVSAEEGTNQESTQEQIFENIRLHKEVIQSVKLQPWPIRKKLKLVRQVSESAFSKRGHALAPLNSISCVNFATLSLSLSLSPSSLCDSLFLF